MKCKFCANEYQEIVCHGCRYIESQKDVVEEQRDFLFRQSLVEIEAMEQAVDKSFSRKQADILKKEIAERNRKVKQNFGKNNLTS